MCCLSAAAGMRKGDTVSSGVGDNSGTAAAGAGWGHSLHLLRDAGNDFNHRGLSKEGQICVSVLPQNPPSP